MKNPTYTDNPALENALRAVDKFWEQSEKEGVPESTWFDGMVLIIGIDIEMEHAQMPCYRKELEARFKAHYDGFTHNAITAPRVTA